PPLYAHAPPTPLPVAAEDDLRAQHARGPEDSRGRSQAQGEGGAQTQGEEEGARAAEGQGQGEEREGAAASLVAQGQTQEGCRIHPRGADLGPEVQVGPGRPTAGPDAPDRLAALDALALADRHRVEVEVEGV